jgi:hypothetical protein
VLKLLSSPPFGLVEQRVEIDDEWIAALDNTPLEPLAHDLGPFVLRSPPLDETRVDVHDPVLIDTRTLKEQSLRAAVRARTSWRNDFDRE